MVSSPGFGSTSCHSIALFRLAFAPAPGVTPLTLRQKVTRRIILQKARGQAFPQRGIALPQFVGTRFQVLFHSPHRGAFHLSLTVLVHYRSLRVFSLGGWAPQFPTGFLVSRGTQDPDQYFASFVYGTLTPCGRPFQCRSTTSLYLLSVLQPRLDRSHVGLGSSAFVRHYSRNTLFSSGYLDVSVPRVPRS